MVSDQRIATSPFNCDWIEKGSEGRVGAFPYAICRRTRARARIVSETECGRCQLWKEPTDVRAECDKQ
jgi:hypothetical protein